MGHHLVLSVRFLGDAQGFARFHGMARGAPEWPPAPARLFQAMVAGVARGAAIPESMCQALASLEALTPPVIAAPRAARCKPFSLYVPNNDADTLADPLDPSPIRTRKVVEASLFSAHDPLIYAWRLPADFSSADAIVEAAEAVYQLGRGVDLAWAEGDVLNDGALDDLLLHHPGEVHRPDVGQGGRRLPCPTAGSLGSLKRRHQTDRLRAEGSGRNARVLFTNPPKPIFQEVSYDREPRRIVFQLRDRDDGTPWPWPLGRVARLVETLRDAAAARLRASLPDAAGEVERMLVGRKRDGRDALPIEQRVRITPLPSIGFVYADRQLRRFLLQVPTGGPIRAADVEWAFSGLDVSVGSGDGGHGLVIVRGDDDDMISHYVGPGYRWRTVTPVVLPESAKRRRIEPARRREEAKTAAERSQEEDRAVAAVHIALRQSGVRGVAVEVRVQREPFDGRGVRAEVFADGTRFEKERLWHIELTLDRPVAGPLVIGDGRFLGLGVMAPAR